MKTVIFTSILYIIIQSKSTVSKETVKYIGKDINGVEYTCFSTNINKNVGDTLYLKK